MAGVDSNKVIQRLAQRIGELEVQRVINEIALEETLAASTELKQQQ